MTRPFDKPDIHAKIDNGVNHILAIADAHLQRQRREIATVAGDYLRENIVPDGAAGEHANGTILLAK
ncbi:hypothetical protein D3C78_1383110 [compost metagenome]